MSIHVIIKLLDGERCLNPACAAIIAHRAGLTLYLIGILCAIIRPLSAKLVFQRICIGLTACVIVLKVVGSRPLYIDCFIIEYAIRFGL